MNKKYDNNNVFAKILRDEIKCNKVCENDVALCFKDINPRAPIHYLVIPKNAYIDMFDFYKNASYEEIVKFWELIESIVPKNGKVQSNFGSYLEVFHFHVHIMGDL